MNININNYEAYFLDYHEGNLSPQQVADLYLFLSQHPELKKEFEEFEHIVLEDFSAPVFEHKDRLKKNITVDNREEYFIRAVEGTLDTTELALLSNFLTTHPEFQIEFTLFQKTKLQADTTITFENKELLKQGAVISDDQLIASIEGLLSKEERVLLERQLAANPERQQAYVTYQQTKSVADTTIVFKNKQTLKRKERKVVPLFYYMAVAASIILLFGILFLLKLKDNSGEQHIANRNIQPVEQQKSVVPTTTIPEKKIDATVITSPTLAAVKNNITVVKKPAHSNKQVNKATGTTTEKQTNSATLPVTDNTIASTGANVEKQSPSVSQTDTNTLSTEKTIAPAIAQIEKKTPAAPEVSIAAAAPAFTSVRDLFVSKLKEKLLGKDATVDAEKKPNAPDKITGWDIAGAFAKGISRITGKKVELKPQFNEQGDVTAYAFSAGKLGFSKGKLK